MMTKLPKALSSVKARSTSLSNRTQDWQHRTTERSGSSIISALIKSGPREPHTIEEQTMMIIKKIKRETTRLKKAQAFGTVPIGRETEASKDREAYILRKEAVVNRLYFQLQELNAQKERIDRREIHKFQYNPRSGDYVGQSEDFVNLEKGKIVAKKTTSLPGSRLMHGPRKYNPPKKPLQIEKYFPKHAAKLKSMAQLVREEKLKKKQFSPAIQAEIDKVFEPVEEVSEEDFEKFMSGED
jgi:hypothetical protein